MEAPVTAIEKLDVILYIISLSAYKSILGIYQYSQTNYGWVLDTQTIKRIVKRLAKDGYAEFDNNSENCNISFDGELFLQAGGYAAKALRDAEAAEQQRIDAARLIQLESQNLTNSGRLNTLTHRLVKATWFAGAAALLLLAWDVVKFLIEHSCKK